ncbi:MAG: rhodanese-like domain-containing protein [Sulfitobacter sp.]
MSSGSPQPDHRTSSSRIARRGLLFGGAAVLTAGAVGIGRWYILQANVGDGTLSAPDADKAVSTGALVLVDIRRPDEWADTGLPKGAVPIDMRRDDFPQALLAALGGDKDYPVALICARGVRSSRISARLSEAGFTKVLDVSEGMLGSRAGPGWLARGLPVTQP